MRSSLVLLAGLAGSALAYPAEVAFERRALGLLNSLLGNGASGVVSTLEGVLGGGSSSSLPALTGITPQGAAALQGGALGLRAGTVQASALKELQSWLQTTDVLTGPLKVSVLSWTEGKVETLTDDVLASLAVYIPSAAQSAAKGSLFVTVDGIVTAAERAASSLVLSLTSQNALSTFLSSGSSSGLDQAALSGLNVAAAGGLVSSLSEEAISTLLSFLQGGNTGMDLSLQKSLLAWANGQQDGSLVSIGSLSDTALTTLGVGSSLISLVEETGLLSIHAQVILGAFLDTKLVVDLDPTVLLALHACAKGELAVSLDVGTRTSLAVWLSSSDCSLGVELKAMVLLWLSLAVTDESVTLVTGLLTDITGLLTETVFSLLSVNLQGALSLLSAGESLTALSFETRAELAALLAGCLDIEILFSIEMIIFQWFTGCSVPGAPSGGSSSTSMPATTATSMPASTATSTATLLPTSSASSESSPVPTSAGPTTSVPSGPAPTSAAPSGPSRVETVTETTHCPDETAPASTSTVAPSPVMTSAPASSAPGTVTKTVYTTKTVCPCA